MMNKQHRLIIAYGLLFQGLILWFLATNFIIWDETPLEKTIIGWFLGLGLAPQVPLYFLAGAINTATDGILLAPGEKTSAFIAICSAYLYTSPILISIVRNFKEIKKAKQYGALQ